MLQAPITSYELSVDRPQQVQEISGSALTRNGLRGCRPPGMEVTGSERTLSTR